MFESYEKNQHICGKIFKVVNSFLIVVLSVLTILIVAYNSFSLILGLNSDKSKSQDYNFLNGKYIVEMSTDAWEVYYKPFSVLFVEEKDVNYDNVIKYKGKKPYKHVYLFKNIYSSGECTYSVGCVISKTKESCVVYGDKEVLYENIVGEVIYDIPYISIFGNAFFIFIYFFVCIFYLGFLIIFSTSTMGHDILFNDRLKKELKKNSSFGIGINESRIKGDNKIMTNEEMVQNLLGFIVTDYNGEKVDKEISLEEVKKALLVLGQCDFSSTEKIFVYFASINLLNSYVKKDYAIESLYKKYFFKKYVANAVEYITRHNLKNVKINKDGNIILINILGLEFSFHFANVPLDSFEEKAWCKIRLQPYACKVFDLFYNKMFLEENFDKAYSDNSIQKNIEIIDKYLKKE